MARKARWWERLVHNAQTKSREQEKQCSHWDSSPQNGAGHTEGGCDGWCWLPTRVDLGSVKRHISGWFCMRISWKNYPRRKVISCRMSGRSPDSRMSEGKAGLPLAYSPSVRASTLLLLPLLSFCSIGTHLLCFPVWTEDQFSRSTLDLQSQTETAEDTSLVDWPATGFSASPICCMSIVGLYHVSQSNKSSL